MLRMHHICCARTSRRRASCASSRQHPRRRWSAGHVSRSGCCALSGRCCATSAADTRSSRPPPSRGACACSVQSATLIARCEPECGLALPCRQEHTHLPTQASALWWRGGGAMSPQAIGPTLQAADDCCAARRRHPLRVSADSRHSLDQRRCLRRLHDGPWSTTLAGNYADGHVSNVMRTLVHRRCFAAPPPSRQASARQSDDTCDEDITLSCGLRVRVKLDTPPRKPSCLTHTHTHHTSETSNKLVLTWRCPVFQKGSLSPL